MIAAPLLLVRETGWEIPLASDAIEMSPFFSEKDR
jgi:hypothetical protein